MDKKDYIEIIDNLKSRLELLLGSGVYDIPYSEVAPVNPLDAVNSEVKDCNACALKNSPVSGTGNPRPEVVFIGGAPEGTEASPYSGSAGELLAKIIEAMGFRKEEVYFSYVVKCVLPEDARNDAALKCKAHLEKEIAALSPRVIVALGPLASKVLIGSGDMKDIRGRFYDYGNVKVMPTYDPETILDMPEFKKDAWEDLKMVLKEIGKEPPVKGKSR